MKIFFDTCSLMPDYYLRREMFSVIKSLADTRGLRMYIPEVVRMELVNQWYENVPKTKTKLAEDEGYALRNLVAEGVVPRGFKGASTFISDSGYEEALDSRLSDLGFVTVPTPDASHKELVKWALSRRKPFNRSGKGYRDALIWLSVLSASADEDKMVFFITSNTDDFCPKDNHRCVHSDFEPSLADATLSLENVVVYQTLAEFFEQHVQPFLSNAADMAMVFQNSPPQTSMLRESVHLELPGIFSYLDWQPLMRNFGHGWEECLAMPTEILSMSVVDAYKSGADALFMTVEVDVAATAWAFSERVTSEMTAVPLKFRLNVSYDLPEREVIDVLFVSCECPMFNIAKGVIQPKGLSSSSSTTTTTVTATYAPTTTTTCTTSSSSTSSPVTTTTTSTSSTSTSSTSTTSSSSSSASTSSASEHRDGSGEGDEE